MKFNLTKCLFSAAVFTMIAMGAKAQTKAETMSQDELYKTIVSLDSALFRSFNECDLKAFRSFFTEDLEFYHDKGGLTLTLESFMKSMDQGLCKPGNKWQSRRELVPGSLRVFPLNKYGAILSGEHTFYERERAGGPEYRRSTAKFTHIFREVNGVWKIARALSYDHQMPKQ